MSRRAAEPSPPPPPPPPTDLAPYHLPNAPPPSFLHDGGRRFLMGKKWTNMTTRGAVAAAQRDRWFGVRKSDADLFFLGWNGATCLFHTCCLHASSSLGGKHFLFCCCTPAATISAVTEAPPPVPIVDPRPLNLPDGEKKGKDGKANGGM